MAYKKRGEMNADEVAKERKGGKERSAAYRERQKMKSESVPKQNKPEALKLLGDRGIKHPYVQQIVWEGLKEAEQESKVPANYFMFTNGFLEAKKAGEAGTNGKEYEPRFPLIDNGDEYPAGELLTRAELFAIWDAFIAPYEQTTFEEFLAIRQNCKKDCFYLGKEILGRDFAHCHRVWADFFPKFDPTTLPANYTQRQAITWLNAQDETKNYLLIASRSAFKSSFSHVWILSAILCQPDIRVMLVSETNPLSKAFIEAIRGWFEVQAGFRTRFQRIFPEYMIPMGADQKHVYECPMAHLRLPQHVQATSMESTQAGFRADIVLFDDPISDNSCGNDEQIEKSVRKHAALTKLRESGGSFTLTLGTPWAHNDLYATMIARAEKNPQLRFAHRIDPAFTVKPEATHKLTPKLLHTLVKEDVEAWLFPEQLSWEFLLEGMGGGNSVVAGFFLSQNLVMFPKAEDDELIVQFEEEVILRHTKPQSFYSNPCQTIMSVDCAWSTSKFADFSCICVCKLTQVENQDALVNTDVLMDRWKTSELIVRIVDMIYKHKPAVLVLEKERGQEKTEEFVQDIKNMCQRRGVPAPYFALVPVAQDKKGKIVRIKRLEMPLASGRLWFVQSAVWNDMCFHQLKIFDGLHDSNSSRKDDYPDALSLLWEKYGPRSTVEDISPEEKAERDAQRLRDQKEEYRYHREQALYQAMFGDVGSLRTETEAQWQQRQRGGSGIVDAKPEPAPAKPMDPRMKVFGNKGPWRL